MPSLFNRRSRSVSTSRPPPPASSSAHAAAAQAFLASRPQQSNLSASAAAAALRSMSPTPTPVNQVQTKRMMNRQNSNSSMASAPRGRSRGTLQRTPSGGSMTERTFRSPSPGRPSTSQGIAPGVGRGAAPPVPAIPMTYTTEDVPPIPQKSHRRSASMEAPPPRVLSPPPTRSAGRGQSIDRDPATGAAALAARRSANMPKIPELERTDSRNSINFSYPRGSRPTSPSPASPITANGTTNGISSAETSAIQRDLTNMAALPVKKKKKIVGSGVAEGSHLQAGSMGKKSVTVASSPGSEQQREQPAGQPVKSKKKKVALTGENTHFPDSLDESAGSVASDSDATPEKIQERRAQRASGMLMKQPSMVREDWEGEQEEQSSPVSPTFPGESSDAQSGPASVVPESGQARKSMPEANMSRKIEEPTASSKVSAYGTATTPSISNKTEVRKTLAPESQSGRPVSISPSRSTRFSDRLSSDLASGRKHDPPPRSVSPAKSALKHQSPARSDASPTEGKFPHRRGSSVTPSEASDVSVDTRRKKSARVSFEDNVETLNTGFEAETYNRTTKESGKKGWFGMGKQKPSVLGTIPAEEDTDDVLQPRPALPAFGSVRRNKPEDAADSTNTKKEPEAMTSNSTANSSSSDVSTTAEPSTMNTSVSSDHAVGGLLFLESHETQPSQTTFGKQQTRGSNDSNQKTLGGKAPQSMHDLTTTNGAYVPVIAIQPATPGIEDINPTNGWSADIPGGFPETDAPNSRLYEETEKARDVPQHHEALTAGKDHEYVEPKMLDAITEEDSDNYSVYSDAAEDLSDLEGDGFGSINAIIRSPVTSPSGKIASSPPMSPPESPSVVGGMRPETNRVASWDETQSHWSGLAQHFRNSAQQAKDVTTPEQQDTPPRSVQDKPLLSSRTLEPPAEIKSKPRKKKTKVIDAASAPAQDAQMGYSAEATKRSSTGKPQGGFRSSMRSEPESTHTLRGERNTMKTSAPAQPRAALQRKAVPTGVAPAPKPVQRTFSNDSDSDTSFRRARRNRKPADGKYSMKRSMRGGPAEVVAPATPATSTHAGRRDVRSMSPIDRRPLSPGGGQRMRMSMRGSQDLGTPSLRGQQEKRSSSLFGRARRAMSPTRAPPTTVVAAPKLKSRVVDSDDELDVRKPTKYKSRFADSSDEDEPEPMRPVRGIPRKADEGDSTDLDDSSDDQRPKAQPAPKKLAINIPPPGEPVSPAPVSPNTAKKTGFWGRLRGKKSDNDSITSVTAQPNGVKSEVDAGKKMSKDDKQLGFTSTAQKEALIEQTRQKLEAAQDRPTSPTGKLQRRSTPQRVLSDSWPLPAKASTADEDRPSSADAVGTSARPELGDRQPTSDTLLSSGGTPIYGRSGKKKKFPMLRRAFGLHD